MNDLVKKWQEISRRDDCFNHMVPSDVRQLLAEIEHLQVIIIEAKRLIGFMTNEKIAEASRLLEKGAN